ncbi:dihydropteroate synthase [Pseudorhodobacter sp.]|uniref:dihydropteroate synthase n=1 Tax=Pseudorhodobacter sp. TaxID=1934400 RepID=UPI00264A1953|nr:dihydropteroate synthase [Pseudorhodobacter sp.]MDN5787301.1 dihydropteroate synthase [Pseudorhodobacter sp.]
MTMDLSALAADRPCVMGILNVTPDSFSDGGDLTSATAAAVRAGEMVGTGADILDIGGESTRPGAEEVPMEEEIRRTAPAIRAIRDAGITAPISIDTRKVKVAEAALAAGADMVNDVSAFRFDPELADLVAAKAIPVCLMHSKGPPATMQQEAQYDDVVAEVRDHLVERMEFAVSRSISLDRIILDPGIGFAKTMAHDLILLNRLRELLDVGQPILLGASRKKFIGRIANVPVAKDRVPGSLAVALHGASLGVQILRVHDVAATVQALAVWRAIRDA